MEISVERESILNEKTQLLKVFVIYLVYFNIIIASSNYLTIIIYFVLNFYLIFLFFAIGHTTISTKDRGNAKH